MHMGVVSIWGEEQRIAAALTESGQRYGEAVASRCAHVAAVERFYADLMVYQWRLDALDVLLSATFAASEDTNSSESVRREGALQQNLEQINALRENALKSVEQRAADYGLAVSSRGIALEVTGISDRLAISSNEKQNALERYQRRVQETFDEIANEAQEIVKVPEGDEGLQGLRNSLQRRRTFWNKQLEETWESWHRVTAGMHRTGDTALDAWRGAIALTRQARRCLRHSAARLPVLARAIGAVAARCLEAEFLIPLGLSGLNGPRSNETSKQNAARRAPVVSSQEWVIGRVEHLVSIFKILQDANSLHEVGEQILQSQNLVCSAGKPMLPNEMIAALSAIATASDMETAREAAGFATLATGGKNPATDRLVPWFSVALVEGLCEVAWHGDAARVVRMIDVCHRLGGEHLLNGLSLARSQSLMHGGRTAIELAIAAGNSEALQLLQGGGSTELPSPESKIQAPVQPKSHAESLFHSPQRSILRAR